MRTRRRLRTLLALSTCTIAGPLLVGGCVSGSSKVQSTGRYIGDQTISRIEPGKTDKAWVLAVLGEPSMKTTLPSGIDLWKWEFSRITTSSGSVFFVVSGKNREETIRTVYVEFQGDLVKQCWRD